MIVRHFFFINFKLNIICYLLWKLCFTYKIHKWKTVRKGISSFYWSIIEWDDLWVGLTLPLRLIFKAVNAFWISIVMALSTLPDDSFLCDFCRCSFSELLLSPAFFPQMGQTFIVGFLCCHSNETFPCSFWSNTCKIFAKPSFGCARWWTCFIVCHAFDKVYFLHK